MKGSTESCPGSRSIHLVSDICFFIATWWHYSPLVPAGNHLFITWQLSLQRCSVTRWLSALSHVTPYRTTSRGQRQKGSRETKRRKEWEGEKGWKNKREEERVGQWGEEKDWRQKTEAQGPHLSPPCWQAVFPRKDLNRIFHLRHFVVCAERVLTSVVQLNQVIDVCVCVFSTAKWCSNLFPSFLMCAVMPFECESLQQGEMFPNVSLQSSSSHTLSLLAPS